MQRTTTIGRRVVISNKLENPALHVFENGLNVDAEIGRWDVEYVRFAARLQDAQLQPALVAKIGAVAI